MGDDIHEECGIAAVSIKNGENDALPYLYKILLNLQGRGQLSAGVTTFDNKRLELLSTHKDIGLVDEVFRTRNSVKNSLIFNKYNGSRGIGHVRYATCGPDDKSCAQPFERFHGRKWKWFSFGFNGNITNFPELKKQLMLKTDYHMLHDTDTEIIMHYISRELYGEKRPDLHNVFSNISKDFDGAYNISFINGYGEIVVARDPFGFKPLCFANKNGTFLAASESNALLNCDMHEFKSLEPGKMILIGENNNIEIKKFVDSKRKAHCMFEWVYFSNISSVLDGKSVYLTRSNLGKELAKLETENITQEHIVVPVPDTAKAAGDAMAYELGLPSKEGLIRNRHVGRTFIEGGDREAKVKNKYTVLKEITKNKKIILVDDSIVRGSTVKQIVRYIKKEGKAKEVHLRISCPPIIAPCFYGIDMSTVSELLAPKYVEKADEAMTEKECGKIAKDLDADSLIYQAIPGLINSIGLPKGNLCMACLNSDYPTECGKEMYKKALLNAKNKIFKRPYDG